MALGWVCFQVSLWVSPVRNVFLVTRVGPAKCTCSTGLNFIFSYAIFQSLGLVSIAAVMVYFPYFESQWASHRGLLRSASHTDLSFACKGGSQVCLPLGINQSYLSEFFLLSKVHVHRAMFVTRSPLLGELLSYPGVSIVSLPEVSCQLFMLNVFENCITTR